jgi:hypothetical protein
MKNFKPNARRCYAILILPVATLIADFCQLTIVYWTYQLPVGYTTW